MLSSTLASATIVWLLCAWQKPLSDVRGKLACLAGCAGGLLAGHGTLKLYPAFPPANGLDRFLTIVLPSILAVQAIAVLVGSSRKNRWLPHGFLAIVVIQVLLYRSVYLGGPHSDWSPWRSTLLLTISAVLWTAIWNLLTALARRSQSTVLLSLAMTILGSGGVILLAGYLKGGSAAIPLAASLFGVSAGAMFCGARSHLHPTIHVGITGLFCLLFIGRFFGGVSTNTSVLLFASPLICWTGHIPSLRTLPPQKLQVMQLLLVTLVVAVVLLVAKHSFDREMAPLLGIPSSTT